MTRPKAGWTPEQRRARNAAEAARRAKSPAREKARQADYRERNRPRLRAYARRLNWKRRGIDATGAEQLLASFGGRCAVCAATEPGPKGWAVDHDHNTGRLRGIICYRCNLAIGLFNDDPARLRAAAAYLETP